MRRTSRLSIALELAAFESRGLVWFFRALGARLAPYKLQCALVVAGLLVDVAFETAVPLSLKFLIDDAIVPRRGRVLAAILIALAIGGAVMACVQVGRDYLYAAIGARLLADLRGAMHAKLQTLSLAFFNTTPAGDIMTRFSTDLASVETVVVLALPAGLMSALSVVASVAVLVVLEWRLAIIGAVGIVLCALGPRLLSARAGAGSHEVKARQSVLATMIQEDVAAQPVVKAFALAPVLEPRFRTAVEKLRKASVRANFAAYLMERTPNIGLLIFNLLVIAAGSYLAFRGRLSIGSLVTFQALLINLSASVYGITSTLPHFVQGATGLQRIDELLADGAMVDDAPAAVPLPRVRSSIQYENVSFGYRYGEPLLQSLDIVLPAGSITAFVGASGSGKSTALNLLARFYDPTTGAIRFDGHDARLITQASLREQTGVVFQESFLFNTTVRENIRYGRLGATDADVEAAAELAQVHHGILELPRGYDTIVGPRGSSLSGGQRQRIAIARALLRDPALLLLDEPTSALDPVTEAALIATIDRLRGDRTIVLVTHRLSSARIADRIVVFANGRVVETGTHAQLVSLDGVYRALWEKQDGESLVSAG